MTDRRPPQAPPRFETYRPVRDPGGPIEPPRRPQRSEAPRGGGDDEKGGSGFFSGALAAVFALIALAVVGAGLVVMLLPADVVRDKITEAVKARTGRDLVIRGASSFRFYPSVGVTLTDVTLSGAPGMASKTPFIAMPSLDASVELLPLLKREVRIGTLVLNKPVFNLEVDKQGRKSWDFAGLALEPGRVRVAEAAKTTATDAPPSVAAAAAPQTPRRTIEDVKLEDVRIVDGTLLYTDAQAGSAQRLDQLNVAVAAHGLSAPLASKGSFLWRARKISFDGALNSVATIISDKTAKISVALVTDRGEASFEGTATFADQTATDGIVKLKSASMRKLLAWLGTDLPPSQGFGPFEAKGLLRATSRSLTLASAEILLDGATAHGQVTLDLPGARPLIKANLKVSELNLNTYASDGTMPAAEPEPAPQPALKPTTAPPAAAGAPAANSIDDILAREPAPAARVKGYTQRAGWSEVPYQIAALGLVDADAKLSVGRILVRDIKIGQTEVSVALKNRNLKTTIEDVRLYEGRGRGFIAVDGSTGKSAAIAANLTFEGISAQPFLTDAADIDKLIGKGRLAFTLAGQGVNEREVVETLNGKVEFSFADGAIAGLNIPKLIRGFGAGGGAGASEKTDFSEFSSTWAVANGVAQNQDLKLVSPLLRVTGSGRVMVPPREIDYVLRPKLVASLEGQGGQQGLNGLEIPVKVEGSWERPRIAPDLEGIARDPNKAIDTLKEIGKQFKGKNPGEIVDGLLGKGSASPDGTPPGGAAATGKKLLDQFLRPPPPQ